MLESVKTVRHRTGIGNKSFRGTPLSKSRNLSKVNVDKSQQVLQNLKENNPDVYQRLNVPKVKNSNTGKLPRVKWQKDSVAKPNILTKIKDSKIFKNVFKMKTFLYAGAVILGLGIISHLVKGNKKQAA